MGTCQSSHRRRHVLADDPCIKHRKRGEDFTETDRDTTDSSTLPLSPDSTLCMNSPFPLRSPRDPFESPGNAATAAVPESPRAVTMTTPRTPHTSFSSSSFSTTATTSSKSHGRAYRARLQKSRHMQQALYQQFNSSGDDRSVDTSSSSYRFAMSSPPTSPPPATDYDFTSTAHVWAERAQPHVTCVALSRQGPTLTHPSPHLYLATATTDQVVVTTVLSDGLGESTTMAQARTVRSLDFSPNGLLAVGGDDCCVTVYRVLLRQDDDDDDDDDDDEVELLQTAQLERVDRVYAVQFSPDGRYLAVGGFDGLVAVYNADMDLVAEIALDGLCFALHWSTDGQQLAFGGSDKRVSIIRVNESWQIATEIRLGSSVQSLSWNRCLAVATTSGVAILEDGRIQQELDMPGKAHTLCWSPNASYLVVSSQNKCTLLETKSYAAVQEIKRSAPIQTLYWGQQMVLAGLPRRYLVIGDDKGVGLLKAGVELRAGDDVSSSTNSHYSHRSNASDWVLKENAFRDMDELATNTSGLAGVNNPFERPSNSNVLAVAFSRGSKSRPSTYFCYATDDCLVTVLSVSDWRPVAELRFPKPVASLAFSVGSRFLAFGCQDSKVYVSETGPNWALVATTTLPAPIRSLMYNKDNSSLAAGTTDGSMALLDPRQGYKIQMRIDDPSPVTSVDYTAKFFCVGREDGTVRIYDTERHECVAEINRRGGAVQSVAFGLSGRCLAVGVSDGHVGIYSAKGGWVLCHQFKASSASIQTVQWTPTGRFLAVGDEKGQIRLMDTVFWMDIDNEHAQAALLLGGKHKNNAISSPSFPLAFSQDGKMLAFARSHSGVRVARTLDWKLAFVLSQSDALSIASSREDDADLMMV